MKAEPASAAEIPNMKSKHRIRGALVGFVALLSAACLLPPMPQSKTRGARIQSVNHAANVFLRVPGTNGVSAAPKSK